MRIIILFTVFALLATFSVFQSCNETSSEVRTEHMPDEVSYNFDVRPILSDKCFKCHGPDANKREAGLRLDIADSAFKALKETPDKFAIVPGKPESSEVFSRLITKDTTLIMPPVNSHLKLSRHEIKVIEKWIKQGANYEKHWAFVPPKKEALPSIKDKSKANNEIDYFIINKLDQNGLEMNPEADKERLLKRVSLDITGLPPTLEMMDQFLKDQSPNAYEKIVDRLLKSPAYGEKMAVHWMDIARFADSHGYQDDNYRTQWPWRDWVIHAFNKNLSYDQFITWQLAGDLIPNATKEQILATGFNRNHKITEEGGVIDEEYRVEYVNDRTNTFGKALIGISIECAACHDHKYDPFSQKEYYELSSFFNNIKEVGLESTVGGPETYAKTPYMEISNEDVQSILKFVNKQDNDRLIVSIMGERDSLRKNYILNRGSYDNHGEEVFPGTPKSILTFDKNLPKNRLGLSKWMFDKKNPLTARVYVNQVWQEFFGNGLVKSSGDFGMQGELPTHPQLLDWLAFDFMENGWDIKRLVKQLVMTSTYRQSAARSENKLKADPENILFSYAPRARVKSEFVKDIVMASSGLLVKTIGGPSVKTYQPPGLWELATSGRGILANYQQDHGDKLYRRGLYAFIKRTVPPPNVMIFDGSNRDQCEVKRSTTNTPLQALVMMNDPQVLEASRVLAARLLDDKISPEDRIQKAFRMIVCRKPKEKELNILVDYYKEQLTKLDKEKNKAVELLNIGEYPLPENADKVTLAAMMRVVSTIYNLEETITKS